MRSWPSWWRSRCCAGAAPAGRGCCSALYVAGTCVLLAASRAQLIGPFALGQGVPLLHRRGDGRRAVPGVGVPAGARRPGGAAGAPLRLPRAAEAAGAALRRTPLRPVAAGGLVVLVLAAGSVVSTINYAQRWHANPARPFVTPPAPTSPSCPAPCWSTRWSPTRCSGTCWAPTRWPRACWPAPRRRGSCTTGSPRAPRRCSTSRATSARPGSPPLTSAVPGPTPNCGWLVADRPVPIPLQFGGVGPWSWVVRVVWLSSTDNTGWIAAGEQRGTGGAARRAARGLRAGLRRGVDRDGRAGRPTAPVCVAADRDRQRPAGARGAPVTADRGRGAGPAAGATRA